MPEPKRPLKVFLCHAHADRDPVRALYARLTQDGVDVWLDKAKLLPGQDWELEIRKAVREADVVVVCLSKQFNQAGFRQKEVRLALDTAMEKPEGEIFIIPARLEECDNLESLRRWHWVDLFEDDGYEMLMRALRARADRIGATLQVKRSWLPRITTPRTKYQKPVEIKNSEELNEKPVYVMGEIPDDEPRDKFPDGWDSEWMPSDELEQSKNKAAEKENQEKVEKEFRYERGKITKKAKRDLWWEKFKIDFRYRLQLLRIYRVPIFILLVAFAIVTPLIIDLSHRIPELTQALTATPSNTAVSLNSTKTPDTLELTNTLLPISSSVPTEVITLTATTLPAEITDAKGVKIELVLVNGSDPFYMDKYEITTELYKACVDAGICSPPTNLIYYNQSEFSSHPVVYIKQEMAKAFCEWRDARLPTEDEWKKAAIGNTTEIYPWGNEISCENANYTYGHADVFRYDGSVAFQTYKYCVGNTVPVGSYEKGKSIFNIYDLVGNVSEWSQTGRAVLGGSWANEKPSPWSRFVYDGVYGTSPAFNTVGFRCVLSP